jgi:hypothetical protein
MKEFFEWVVFWLIVIGSAISILGLFYMTLLIQPVC